MTSEVQVFTKDSIKLNFLQDILGGLIELSFSLGNSAGEDYATSVHEDGKRVQVFGKFNVSEDPSGETLTIRPIVIDAPLKITLHAKANFAGKTASVVRSKTKAVDCEFEIDSNTSFIELLPQGKQCYLMKVDNGRAGTQAPSTNASAKPVSASLTGTPASRSEAGMEEEAPSRAFESMPLSPNGSSATSSEVREFDLGGDFGLQDDRFASFDINSDSVIDTTIEQARQDQRIDPIQRDYVGEQSSMSEMGASNQKADSDLARIEQEISVVERQQSQLSQKKQSAIDHLEKIEAEYRKDYASLEAELEEIKSRMEADESVIEHYKEQDLTPIEIIFQEIKLKLEEAEEQIRVFVEAKQRKTMEIENEIKATRNRAS